MTAEIVSQVMATLLASGADVTAVDSHANSARTPHYLSFEWVNHDLSFEWVHLRRRRVRRPHLPATPTHLGYFPRGTGAPLRRARGAPRRLISSPLPRCGVAHADFAE